MLKHYLLKEEIGIYITKYGYLTIIEENDKIIEIYFKDIKSKDDTKETPLIKETYKQIDEYLKGERKKFTLPLNPKGTDFQKKVWKALCSIPYGETRTYKDISIKIKSPKAYRVVGSANNKNPIPIIIPCHRVIGVNNKLIGYAYGLDMKRELLEMENKNRD